MNVQVDLGVPHSTVDLLLAQRLQVRCLAFPNFDVAEIDQQPTANSAKLISWSNPIVNGKPVQQKVQVQRFHQKYPYLGIWTHDLPTHVFSAKICNSPLNQFVPGLQGTLELSLKLLRWPPVTSPGACTSRVYYLIYVFLSSQKFLIKYLLRLAVQWNSCPTYSADPDLILGTCSDVSELHRGWLNLLVPTKQRQRI